ncbi:MAG TPA: hypothetical protein VH743_09290 [Beijerinckiaceae bacterium]
MSVATMTLARTVEEERALRAALRSLAQLGAPVFVSDGGSSEHFRASLRALPNVTVLQPPRPGLVPQIRASLEAASARRTPFVLYTEPDKRQFFERDLERFIADAPDHPGLGASIVARTAASFATFPATQQLTEGTINALFGAEVGVADDFCYGPLILNRELVGRIRDVEDELGWGWRFYVIGAAQRLGYPLHAFATDVPCPPDQRADDVGDRKHRLRQLVQNLEGVLQVMDNWEPS